jgi:hypothetical protein
MKGLDFWRSSLFLSRPASQAGVLVVLVVFLVEDGLDLVGFFSSLFRLFIDQRTFWVPEITSKMTNENLCETVSSRASCIA